MLFFFCSLLCDDIKILNKRKKNMHIFKIYETKQLLDYYFKKFNTCKRIFLRNF